MSQKQLSKEDETQIFLEGMGFEAVEDKPGLYRKSLSNGSAGFWDFRKQPRGRFYVSNDEGFMNDKDAQQLPEYVEIRRRLGEEPVSTKKNVKTVAPKVNELTVLERKDQAFDLMNQRDDDQVLMEIQGGFLEEFVYSFPTREGKVTGLSWAGVKEVARQMTNISVEECDIRETDGSWQVKCKAKDLTRNVTMFGVAEQSKEMSLKSGATQKDMHSLSKCVSRAQRNAIRGLIPELFIKKMIERYMEDRA